MAQARRQAAGPDDSQWTGQGSHYQKVAKRTKEWRCARCGTQDGRLTVHHIDRNRRNADEANLEVLCWPCHMREHGRVPGNAGQAPPRLGNAGVVEKTCATCGVTFLAWRHEEADRRYCSRKCWGANPAVRAAFSARRRAVLAATPPEVLSERMRRASHARRAHS